MRACCRSSRARKRRWRSRSSHGACSSRRWPTPPPPERRPTRIDAWRRREMDNANLLEGMRVVEAAAFVAAPLGGMTLAQMGAEVIRIDALGGGLDYRRWPVTQDGTSLFWAGLNKGKKSVALDLGSAE